MAGKSCGRLESLEECALGYLARGWSVIPIRARDKRPLLRWAEFQHRPPTEDEVRGWFRGRDNINVGIVTGERSGLVVIDVDPKHGGKESLARAEGLHGTLPRTVEATSGGGGRHVYLRHPGRIVRNKVGVYPGVDLRGDGGYVVAPPSLHASGRRYAWKTGHEPESVPLADMPQWLVEVLRAPSERPGHPLRHWRELAGKRVREGERNNTIASFAGHLLWHGVDPEVVLELLRCWNAHRCSPPLPDEEVVRTVQSISRLHEQQE